VGTAGPDPWAVLPASGAWRPGDDPGDRRFALMATDEPLALEAGGSLGPITVAYETWGRLNGDASNAVLVLHALTGDSHLVGPPGPGQVSGGWWDSLVGPGCPLDPDRWFVVCPNVLGGCHGTTGPSSPAPGSTASPGPSTVSPGPVPSSPGPSTASPGPSPSSPGRRFDPTGAGRPWGSRFPLLTVRDQVAAEAALADALGIDRWAAVIGGSMGGMRALEWAVGHPHRVARAVVVACGAAATAEQIAWCAVQAQAIRLDPGWAGGDYYDAPAGHGPARGLGVARRLGHVTYRSETELADRFGRHPQSGEDPLGGLLPPGGRAGAGAGGREPDGEPPAPGWVGGPALPVGRRFSVESYLDHQAAKLAARFDANSYLVLSRAMDLHDVGRDRGGVAAALAGVTAEVTVAGVDSDRLYPLRLQEDLVAALPTAGALRVITSAAGHDGFLVEQDQIAKVVTDALG
jgi:homoserine O-acetyltransferase